MGGRFRSRKPSILKVVKPEKETLVTDHGTNPTVMQTTVVQTAVVPTTRIKITNGFGHALVLIVSKSEEKCYEYLISFGCILKLTSLTMNFVVHK